MPSRPPVHRPAGYKPPEQRKREADKRRGNARQRGYDADWERARLVVLAEEPMCRFCAERGDATPAREVDHIIPIADRPDLRLTRSNLRSLCRPCHSRRTVRDQGFARGQ